MWNEIEDGMGFAGFLPDKSDKELNHKMRTFDVLLEHKEKKLLYKDLTGKKAIKLMEDLIKRGYETVAFTESVGYVETLTLKEMKEVVL